MSKFQVGERAAMFSCHGKQIVSVVSIEESELGLIAVSFRPGHFVMAHPLQLRKIKKRMTIWIPTSHVKELKRNEDFMPTVYSPFPKNVSPVASMTKFIEVKE